MSSVVASRLLIANRLLDLPADAKLTIGLHHRDIFPQRRFQMALPSIPNLPWLVIRHVEHEHIGALASALEEAKMTWRHLDVFRGDRVPEQLADARGLIVMGGPMGVYEADKYPFLVQEQALIRDVADRGLPVLGICLGAQLIAAALGARVYSGGKKEIGWYPVEITAPNDRFVQGLPSSFMAFHWHGDTFDLPAGAVRLFRSQLYQNQGFRWGTRVFAIQFHFEADAPLVDDWLRDGGCCAELETMPDVRAENIRNDTEKWAGPLQQLNRVVFRRFLTDVT